MGMLDFCSRCVVRSGWVSGQKWGLRSGWLSGLSLGAAVFVLCACQPKPADSTNLSDSSSSTNPLITENSSTLLPSPATTSTANSKEVDANEDSKEPREFEADDPALKFIRTQIYPNGEWKDLSPEHRRYSLAYHDLNDSGEKEILLMIPTMYHCGSGGCRLWILDKDGQLLSTSSVVDFPLGISSHASNGWKDLLTWSNHSNRVLIHNGESYSHNASLADKITEEQRREMTVVEVLKDAFESELQF